MTWNVYMYIRAAWWTATCHDELCISYGGEKYFLYYRCNERNSLSSHYMTCISHMFIYIFLPTTKIQYSKLASQHVAARRSSSCHTILHIHVSIRVMWRENINQYIWNTTYTFCRNTKLKARHSPSQLVMPHECTHPRSSHLISDDKSVIRYICNMTYTFHLNTKFKLVT
jgi:hypothetical protein